MEMDASAHAVDHSRTEVESPELSESDNEKCGQIVPASSEESQETHEHVPRLHAKTFLTIFAICLIYFAQLINVVGAGAVSSLQSVQLILLL